jgi:hypothetical protein
MRLRSFLAPLAVSAIVAVAFACSDGKSTPPSTDVDKDGGVPDSGPAKTDASDGGDADAGPQQAGTPSEIVHASTKCGAVDCGIMGVKNSGFQETADVGFLVKDKDGKPVVNATVKFVIEGAPPGTELLGSPEPDGSVLAKTNDKGIATGRVQSGATLGVFTLRATIDAISAQSPAIGVRGVTPSNRGSIIQCDTRNLAAYVSPNPPFSLKTNCTIKLVDRFNNPVGKTTTINLKPEAGSIASSVLSEPFKATGGNDAEGTAKVEFSTLGTFPPAETTPLAGEFTGPGGNQRDGLVTVLAYVSGEEAFDDNNANGTWDSGENFIDQGEPFVDANDNNQWDAGEFYADLPACPASKPVGCLPAEKKPNGIYDGPNGRWDKDTTIWMVTYLVYTGVMIPAHMIFTPTLPASIGLNTNAIYDFSVADSRFNRPQAGAVFGSGFNRLSSRGTAGYVSNPVLDGYSFNINRALFDASKPADSCSPSATSCIWLTKFTFPDPYTLVGKLTVKGATTDGNDELDTFTLSATVHQNKSERNFQVTFQ